MTAAEERLARRVAAALRALEWDVEVIDRAVIAQVRAIHPETREACAAVGVDHGRMRLRWASPTYEAGILAALEHVERQQRAAKRRAA